MRHILITTILFCSLTASAQIKFKIGTDAATGKVIKYANVEMRFQAGRPIEVIGKVTYHEVANEADDAIPVNATEPAKRAIQGYNENFSIIDKFIDPATNLYVDSSDPLAVALPDHLAAKAINSYPSTNNGDPLSKLIEGICKELFVIRKLNGEFSN